MINGPLNQQQLASVASTVHQVLPGAAALPPSGLGTAAGRATGYFKPYKDHDYQHFSGRVKEYGGLKREWQDKILPYMTAEIALREINRCTPKSIDLSIFMYVDQA